MTTINPTPGARQLMKDVLDNAIPYPKDELEMIAMAKAFEPSSEVIDLLRAIINTHEEDD